jgi:enoyl-[acyl-carrier protein] reductase III
VTGANVRLWQAPPVVRGVAADAEGDGSDVTATTGRPLEGRTVLVTGGSRGLGAATSRRLARMGARVILTYRSREDEAAVVVADCEAATPGARAEPLDLLEEASVRDLFASIAERDGHLDVVVANAAATAFKPLLELKMHQIDKTFAISVRHFLLLAQLAFPLLQPRGGRIVAISGADTVGYIPGHGLLAAAKAGMETIVRYLACELGPQGVTAVGVLPGYVDTDSIKLMTGPFHDKLLAAEELTHPLRAAATPDDASEAIALVCLPEARWLNGQIVQNDGAGLFAYMGRFGQAWSMVPDDAVSPDVTGAPMLGGDA